MLSALTLKTLRSFAFVHTLFGAIIDARRCPCGTGQGGYSDRNCNLTVTAVVTGFSRAITWVYQKRLQGYSKTPRTHAHAPAPAITHARDLYPCNLVTASLYLLDEKEKKSSRDGYKSGYSRLQRRPLLTNPLNSFKMGRI